MKRYAALFLAPLALMLGAAAESNLLKDPAFETLGKDNAAWAVQTHEGSQMTASVADAKATIDVTRKGTQSWHLQFMQNDVEFKKDTQYVLTFTATGKLEGVLEVLAMRNGEPWEWFGDLAGFELTDKPKTFTYKFKPNADVSSGRITFQLGMATGQATISDVKLVAE
jgi:hypothetical protein